MTLPAMPVTVCTARQVMDIRPEGNPSVRYNAPHFAIAFKHGILPF